MNLQQQKQTRNQSDSINVPVQVHGGNIVVAPPPFPIIGPPDADGPASAAAVPAAQGSPPLGYNQSPTPTLPAPPGARLERDRSERRLLWADEIGQQLRLQAPPPATYELTPTANPPVEGPAALTEALEPPPFDYHSLRVEAPETPQTRIGTDSLAPPQELHHQKRFRDEDSDVHFEPSLDQQHPLEAHAYGQEIEYRYSIDTSASPR